MKFSVVKTGEGAQTAIMTLGPGEASGEKANEHVASEQVLYVVSGEIRAEVGDQTFVLSAGDSTIVPKGVAHRFSNQGSGAAETFNVYSPPAY